MLRFAPIVIFIAAVHGHFGPAARALASEHSNHTTNATDLKVERLRCEYQTDPLGIDVRTPRLSWILCSGERGQCQTAYQVLVSSSRDLLDRNEGDLWDSGKVVSDRSILVSYAGKPLISRLQCHWKVRVWDKDGRQSPWSTPARWTMGLLNPEDWQALWIAALTTMPKPVKQGETVTPLPLLRREFRVEKSVRRADLFICGLGFYELYMNGKKVGISVLDPGWTNYRKTCLYASHDVTQLLVEGGNALGIMLGNGMYNVTGGRYTKFTGSFGPPKVILQLHIEYDDGSTSVVTSDAQWKTAAGPIIFSCIFGGEDYDARMEQPGWDRPGFDDSSWASAQTTDGPGGRLVAQSAPPIKIVREFSPIKVAQPKPGVYVYDLGQNFSGWPRLTVQGPAGSIVKMTPGELLDDAGLVSQRSSGGPVCFSYTLKGKEKEIWHPQFSYYGFRYVQVDGAVPLNADAPANSPRLLELTGQFVRSSAVTVGDFSCSDTNINKIHELIGAAIQSNLQSVLTDCPHREKLGWLEVSHLLAEGIMYNYDVPTLYAKICDDMRDTQLVNGLVPNIAPEYAVFSGGFRDSPEWGSACVINPWHVYQMYGDISVAEKQYESIKRYVAYLRSKAKNHIVSYGLGDWCDVGPGPSGRLQLTSPGLTATAIYYQNLVILNHLAVLLDRPSDAEEYAKLADDVRTAFNNAFFKTDKNHYDRNSQTANAMPLALRMVGDGQRDAVQQNLVDSIRADGNQVKVGDVGFVYLVRALCDAQRGNVLFDMICREDGPGYMLQLRKGCTSLAETWDANPALSMNHCMLGHAEEWFFRGLGGIRPDPAGPGFKKIIIRPVVPDGINWVEARYDSIHGLIATAWKREGNAFLLDVAIPPNTTATVYLPAENPAEVTESGKPAAQSTGIKFLRSEDGRAVFSLESGRYQFATGQKG